MSVFVQFGKQLAPEIKDNATFPYGSLMSICTS
jgi:hypothetical protein